MYLYWLLFQYSTERDEHRLPAVILYLSVGVCECTCIGCRFSAERDEHRLPAVFVVVQAAKSAQLTVWFNVTVDPVRHDTHYRSSPLQLRHRDGLFDPMLLWILPFVIPPRLEELCDRSFHHSVCEQDNHQCNNEHRPHMLSIGMGLPSRNY